MITTIIGTGLLGGSFALSLREKGFSDHIIGVDHNAQTLAKAMELGIVDETMSLDQAVSQSDLIVIAVPVDKIPQIALTILDQIESSDLSAAVIDLGSTKEELCQKIAHHPLRASFVATHPMWGTEHSGPQAAAANAHKAFAGRSVVICERERSNPEILTVVEKIYTAFGMPLLYMQADEHDLHAAYVSHISHITSFALALTVLEKEREDDAIFTMAGGGFESTVRLAKSSVDMWLPIFMQNKYNVLEVLRENIHQLQIFRKLIENDDQQALRSLIAKANTIKRIL